MSRPSKKSQYTEKELRAIYVIINPLTQEFFVGHCRSDILINVFKQHYYGERYHTQKSLNDLKTAGHHPCLFKLEEVYTTKVKAYSYVIIWTKIFSENGFINLSTGNVVHYMQDLFEENQQLYEDRKSINLPSLLTCGNCLVSNYGRSICQLRQVEHTNG